MANNSKIEVRGSQDNGTTDILDSSLLTNYFTAGVTQQQAVTLTASIFTAITVPTGAKAVLITGLTGTATLKGVTGDTGIVLGTNSPILIPLGTTPSIGITETSGANQTIQLMWF